MVLVYHLAPGFLSLLLTKERKDKSEEGRRMGEDKTRERERKRLVTRKCRPVITSLRVIYSGREGNGINHARWR